MLPEQSMKSHLREIAIIFIRRAGIEIGGRTNTKAQWRSPLEWRILETWTAARSRFHSPVFIPCGPEGFTAAEVGRGIRRRQPRRMRREIYESYAFTCVSSR
jgi:hypothetical protein